MNGILVLFKKKTGNLPAEQWACPSNISEMTCILENFDCYCPVTLLVRILINIPFFYSHFFEGGGEGIVRRGRRYPGR